MMRKKRSILSLHEEFVEVSVAGIDENVIRQFGIGFYLAYLVFEKMIVTTKHNDDEEKFLKKKIKEASCEWSLVDKQMTIWMRKSGEIIKEEYAVFYKSLTND
ncbi:hypothetical protein VitviT2T_007754 [Vitis vinifera]|uniref:Uncharacterized protein n=1 Tax=Vitis vinifera TaxID=29760 RepID=A0ABY9BZT8_VITVI|nr:hypothetical protein VitviT2T_007754 [Vitis vinifera]